MDDAIALAASGVVGLGLGYALTRWRAFTSDSPEVVVEYDDTPIHFAGVRDACEHEFTSVVSHGRNIGRWRCDKCGALRAVK